MNEYERHSNWNFFWFKFFFFTQCTWFGLSVAHQVLDLHVKHMAKWERTTEFFFKDDSSLTWKADWPQTLSLRKKRRNVNIRRSDLYVYIHVVRFGNSHQHLKGKDQGPGVYPHMKGGGFTCLLWVIGFSFQEKPEHLPCMGQSWKCSRLSNQILDFPKKRKDFVSAKVYISLSWSHTSWINSPFRTPVKGEFVNSVNSIQSLCGFISRSEKYNSEIAKRKRNKR